MSWASDSKRRRLMCWISSLTVLLSAACRPTDATQLSMSGLTTGAVHALFNPQTPAGGPFPSDQFTVPDDSQITGRRVNLPEPDCAERPSDCEDIAVINTLDGFNLQPRLTVTFDGPIDPSTVNSKTVFLVAFGGLTNPPRFIGINQIVWDPPTHGLYVYSDEALDQDARYALIVTRGLLDTSGAPVHASRHFLSFVKWGTGEYRTSLLQGLSAAEALGIQPSDIVTASVFTTLSATAILEKIRDQIKATQATPASFVSNGVRTVFAVDTLRSILSHRQTRVDPPGFTAADFDPNLKLLKFVPGALGAVAFGTYLSPDYQTSDKYIPAVGTATGTPMVQSVEERTLVVVLPAGAKPANGWPVAIFGHGGGSSKEGAFFSSSVMAAHGLATIAVTIPGHGFGPLSTIEVNLTTGQQVTFLAGGRGVDLDGDHTIDGNEGFDTAPYGHGRLTIIQNRDGLRQPVADLVQLVRVIEIGMDIDGDGQPDLDVSRIYYFGQSQGGNYGIDFLALEPNVRVGVPIGSSGSRPEFRRYSPISRNREGLLLQERIPSLLNSPAITEINGVPVGPPFFNENKPRRNLPPVINKVVGAIEIQEFMDREAWLHEAADPVIYAKYLRAAPRPGVLAKSLIMAYAKGDQSVPNPTNTTIINAGNLADVTTYYRNDLAYAENPMVPTNPHFFEALILDPSPIVSAIALGNRSRYRLSSSRMAHQ